MKNRSTYLLLFLFAITFALSCTKKESYSSIKEEDGYSKLIKDEKTNIPQPVVSGNLDDAIHQIQVKEILPAKKYLYLFVEENNAKYWIAIIKKDIHINQTYFYKKRLLKTHFKSVEHNKVFDTIYLVSNLVEANHGNSMRQMPVQSGISKAQEKKGPVKTTTQSTGIKISELIANKSKYKGKTVTLSGTCVKVNPNIMGRNWIHLKDGSADDFDLVITSNQMAESGMEITVSGTVSLNKDFGAGYQYDLIIENAEILNGKQ